MNKIFRAPSRTLAGKVASRVTIATELARRDDDTLLAAVDTSVRGLDEAQIDARLHRDGINEIAREKPPHWLLQLLRATRNPFIVGLLVLDGVQLFTDGGDLTGPVIIAVMVGISVLLNFTQELRFARAAENSRPWCATAT